MHFAAPTFARTTPAKTRKRPQIPKSPFWGISIFCKSLYGAANSTKLVGGYFKKSALGDAEASPRNGWAAD